MIVLTRAFCVQGHNLIREGEAKFQGFNGVHLWVSDGTTQGVVVVSPIHGDSSKGGLTFGEGARLELACPECHVPLPPLCRCSCGDGGTLRTLYLTPDLCDAHQAAVCDIWACPRSRVVDSNEILSEVINSELER
jgi:ELWxxDGT repeat protein